MKTRAFGAAQLTLHMVLLLSVSLAACEPSAVQVGDACELALDCGEGWACIGRTCRHSPWLDAGRDQDGSADVSGAGADAGNPTMGPIASVSVGGSHTCAINVNGDLWCWGRNHHGQLGDGTDHDRVYPVLIGNGWMSVSTGDEHTCGIKTDGALFCWGYNGHGQLGDDTQTDRWTPTGLVGQVWDSVSAGDHHTCGVTAVGWLWCWGKNWEGQLGIGGTTSVHAPFPLGDGWSQVSAGIAYTCGIKADRTLWCWGFSGTGGEERPWQPVTYVKPTLFSDDTTWQTVDAGRHFACSTKFDQSLWCWGSNGGEFSDLGSFFEKPIPVLTGVQLVSGGYWHICNIDTSATLRCRGDNAKGQLGIRGASESESDLGAGWKDVDAGYWHTCAIKSDSTLYCWGSDEHGKVGRGFGGAIALPTRVAYQ